MNATGPRRAFSLRARLLATMLATLTVVWLAASIASYAQGRHELDELLDAHLATSAALLVAQASDDLEEIRLEHLPDLGDAHQRLALQVWNDGQLGVHSANAPDAALAPFRRGFADVRVAGKAWRVYVARGQDDVWVQVGEPQSAREDILRESLDRQALPMLLALPLLGFGLWIVVGRGLSPLQRLAHAVEARAPLDTAPIADAGAPEEVRPLLDRLNALFARTGESIARERRFIGDASHELRTPVAAIRAQAQVAQGARDDAERQRALAGVIAGCDRMTALTEQLLTLSRLEAGVLDAGKADALLRACAEDVIAELAPVIRRTGASVELAMPADLKIGCGPQLVHSVLRNLIGNALRHGGDGVRVRVTAQCDAGVTMLDVADDGPGIPPERRADALQRFHRLDAATGDGAGLGLAIVGRIAEVCGGTMTLGEGIDGRGLGVRLRLPDRA